MTMQHSVSHVHILHTHIHKKIPFENIQTSTIIAILCTEYMSWEITRERERRQRDKEDLPFVVPILQEALAPAFCFIPADLFPLSAKQRGPSKLCVRDVRRCKLCTCSPPCSFSTSTAMMRRLPASQCKLVLPYDSLFSPSLPPPLSLSFISLTLSQHTRTYTASKNKYGLKSHHIKWVEADDDSWK